jgi:hypothetical protein
MGNLIDFSDEPNESHKASDSSLSRFNSDLTQLEPSSIRRKSVAENGAKAPPPRPSKPLSLRSRTLSLDNARYDTKAENLPAKPSHQTRERTSKPNNPLPEEEKQKTNTSSSSNDTYLSSASAKAAQAYNAMPNVSSYIPQIPFGGDNSLPQSLNSSSENLSSRRAITAKAASYAASASSRLSAYRSSRPNVQPSTMHPSSSDSDLPSGATTPPINKKLDLWKRRWARAKEILDKEGVVLVKWRKGADVADQATQLVEKAMREMGRSKSSGFEEDKLVWESDKRRLMN